MTRRCTMWARRSPRGLARWCRSCGSVKSDVGDNIFRLLTLWGSDGPVSPDSYMIAMIVLIVSIVGCIEEKKLFDTSFL